MSEPKKGGRRKEEHQPFTEIFCELTSQMSQKEIAEKVGVSRQNVGRWLTGASIPDAFALVKVANAFNVSIDYLLGRTDVKSTLPSMKSACEFTGLSELAVDNVRRAKHASLLLERAEFSELTECLYRIMIAASNSFGAKAAKYDTISVFDHIVSALDEIESKEVTVTCCGEKKHYKSRGEAIRVFQEAAAACEGAEQERYSRILNQLIDGLLNCTDED